MTKNYIVANPMDFMGNTDAIPADILQKMIEAKKNQGIGD